MASVEDVKDLSGAGGGFAGGVGPGGECGSACGGAGAMCCEAEGAVTSTSWQFVGEGQGAYSKGSSYNYVGEGSGSFDKATTVAYYGWKVRPCCIGLSSLLVLSGLIYMLSTM